MKNYVGINLFEHDLRQKMMERIDLFVKYMKYKFEEDPELNEVKTKKEWTREFKRWSNKISEVNMDLEILEYLCNGIKEKDQ